MEWLGDRLVLYCKKIRQLLVEEGSLVEVIDSFILSQRGIFVTHSSSTSWYDVTNSGAQCVGVSKPCMYV